MGTGRLRITTQPEFLPTAPENVRKDYTADAMGNTLLRNPGASDKFTDVSGSSGTRVVGTGAATHGMPITMAFPKSQRTGSSPDRSVEHELLTRSRLGRWTRETGWQEGLRNLWSAINEFIRADYTWSGYQRNNFYLNNRDGTFAEAAGVLGLDCIEDSRSFTLSDLDGDGRLELVLKIVLLRSSGCFRTGSTVSAPRLHFH